MLDRDGYRPNVGIIIANLRNQVFWGKRVHQHAWQFPQGGIKHGESPESAMFRELGEEIGVRLASGEAPVRWFRIEACESTGWEFVWVYRLRYDGPLTLDPLTQLPSGVQFSFFASAFVFGKDDLPLSRIPFAEFVKCAEDGVLEPGPAHVFSFDEIVAAHRLLASGAARGKIVVRAS